MTQTFWLSFCDADRPAGEQFLGVAVVDVTQAEMWLAMPAVLARRAEMDQPPPTEIDTYWLAAAIRNAHRLGCNPGGEVASVRIDTHQDFARVSPWYPRGRLLTRAELEVLEVRAALQV